MSKNFNQKIHHIADKQAEEAMPDRKASVEKESLFQEINTLDDFIRHEEFRLKRKEMDSERQLRETNANKAFWFSLGWAAFILAVVLVKMFDPTCGLNQTEYIATIGTLSITILTYYMVVVRHLFSRGIDTSKE